MLAHTRIIKRLSVLLYLGIVLVVLLVSQYFPTPSLAVLADEAENYQHTSSDEQPQEQP